MKEIFFILFIGVHYSFNPTSTGGEGVRGPIGTFDFIMSLTQCLLIRTVVNILDVISRKKNAWLHDGTSGTSAREICA